MLTMVLSPEFLAEEKVIAPDFRASAFEKFLADGGVNSPDLYMCREPEDFSFESVLEIEPVIASAEPEFYGRPA